MKLSEFRRALDAAAANSDNPDPEIRIYRGDFSTPVKSMYASGTPERDEITIMAFDYGEAPLDGED